MRHGTTGRRQRNNRSGARKPGQQRNQVFDSNGPDVRIRGTAHQIAEKYEALAKDASGAGDIVLAESYLQHAEHYVRVIGSWGPEMTSQGAAEKDNEDSENQQGSNQQKKADHRPLTQKKEDDLGLPSSILNAGADGTLQSA